MYHITASAPTVWSPSLKISVRSHIPYVGHCGSGSSRTTLPGHAASVGENP